ncbi:MAG: hypothetical protein ACFCUM_07140 [Bacteroidales bacterium]
MLRIFFTVIISAVIFSCGQQTRDRNGDNDDMVVRVESLESSLQEAERAFLDNLSGLCGQSFRGKELYTAPGRDSWAEKEFVMHVTVCEDDRVHIPFHLDDDHSRTWMFLAEENGLRFRHDHRHEDGTPEDQTLYGGYADGTGSAFLQKFPADQYTIDLLTDTLGREWRVILAEDLSTMTYQLHYSGQLMFAAEFDLTEPI